MNATSLARFDLVRMLGQGGAGVVYEACDRTRGTRVALKKLHRVSPERIARLKNEFDALKNVVHPNLVELGDFVCEGDECYSTMELVLGEDLLAYVRGGKRAPSFDEARLRDALRQIALGLCALHDAGLVHRDVKPSNVRVTAEGRVVLLDFGLVAQIDGERSEGESGTPEYMAPEQAAGDAIAAPADWYSVGVILYEALTGGLPFTGSAISILEEKQRSEPKPPRTRVPSVPADLDGLCAALLRFDASARPTARRVLRIVSAKSPAGYASRTRETPFVGRAREIELLTRAHDEARTRGASSVLIRGDSGVGKSMLVQHFTTALKRSSPDAIIASARCYERGSTPFGAWHGIVDALSRAITRLPHAEAARVLPPDTPSLARMFRSFQRVLAIASHAREATAVDPLETRSRAFAALREILTRLAERGPLVLVVEDVEWADEDSRVLLSETLFPPDTPAILLLATLDAELAEANAAGAAFAQALPGTAHVIDLAPLERNEASALASALLERTDRKGDAEAIAREADGHPLLVDAIVRRDVARAEGASPAPPLREATRGARLEEALWSCIEPLDAMARSILDVLAVEAGPLQEDELSHAVGAPAIDVAKRVALLRVAHLLHPANAAAPHAVDLHHARVRAALRAHLAADANRAIHERLATVQKTVGDASDAGAIATHAHRAGDAVHAARFAVLAADRAADALAFHRAARLYELALAWGDTRGEERRVLQAKLGDSLALSGQGALAAKALQAAAQGATAAESLTLRQRAGETLLRAGHFEDGVRAIKDVLASSAIRFPSTRIGALLALLAWRAFLRVRGLRFREREESQIAARDLVRMDACSSAALALALIDSLRCWLLQVQGLVLALRAGDLLRVARGVGEITAYAATTGQSARADRMALQTMALAERCAKPEALARARFYCAFTFYVTARFRRAFELLEIVLADRSPSSALVIANAQFLALATLALLGDLKELNRRRPLYLREAADRGDLYTAVRVRLGYPSIALLARDAPGAARAEIAAAMGQWLKDGFPVEHFYALISTANVELYAGQAARAYEHIAEKLPAVRRARLFAIPSIRIMAFFTRGRSALAAAVADRTRARALFDCAEHDARALEREAGPWSVAFATLLRAGLAKARARDLDRARELLRRASSELDAVDMALHAACARRALGELSGGDEGRALVERADAWMAAQTVQNPARMAAMIAPAFDEP